jgi:NAD(P)-dependent dehydrogenase (short-subunit alcohol dehydrogenase family)
MKRLVLEGKVAVVTGGARGIGRAICQRYVEEGAKVAVADIDLKEAQAAAKTMGESAFAVQLDVTRQESIDAMVKSVVERASSLDILVNNAGIVSIGPFLEITPQIFDRIFAVNVRELLFTLKAAVISLTQSAGLALIKDKIQRQRNLARRGRYADVGRKRRIVCQIRESPAR